MFCSKCGTGLPDGSQVCSKCGNILGGSPIAPATQISMGISCPNCKSKNLQVSTENNMTASGKGYSGGKGCLGFLLLGPLGLLCGSCGNKPRVTTTNKTFWVCQNCGNKFRNAQELMKETGRQFRACIGFGIFFAILTICFFALWPFARADVGKSMDTLFILSGGSCAIFTAVLIGYGIKYRNDYQKAKAQHEENQRNANG